MVRQHSKEMQQDDEQNSSDDERRLQQEEQQVAPPAMAIAGTEQEAVKALAAVWAATQEGKTSPPIPNEEIRGLIKEYNDIIPEVCPVDGTATKTAMKISGTREGDGEGPAIMRNRLARALLRLTRIDHGNYEQVKEQFEPALWLRRCRMEVLLRGRAPPDDDTQLEQEMLGEFKETGWVTMWDGWGDHDRFHSGGTSDKGEGGTKDPKACPHGKAGLCAECDMEKS